MPCGPRCPIAGNMATTAKSSPRSPRLRRRGVGERRPLRGRARPQRPAGSGQCHEHLPGRRQRPVRDRSLVLRQAVTHRCQNGLAISLPITVTPSRNAPRTDSRRDRRRTPRSSSGCNPADARRTVVAPTLLQRRGMKLIDAFARRRGEAEMQVGFVVRRHRMIGDADPQTDTVIAAVTEAARVGTFADDSPAASAPHRRIVWNARCRERQSRYDRTWKPLFDAVKSCLTVYLVIYAGTKIPSQPSRWLD